MHDEDIWMSVDWGTSAFRLRVVRGGTGRFVTEVRHSQGIAATYQLWKQGGEPETGRTAFYKTFLLDRIREAESGAGLSLEGVPLLLSGMAGSSIGMQPLGYARLPFPANGSMSGPVMEAAAPAFPYPVLLIPGVASDNDVMRGEETKLIGAVECLRAAGQLPETAWFLLPGTHAKHLLVERGVMTRFETFMTGEVFGLLAEKSILAASVSRAGARDWPAFAAGVTTGAAVPFLHAIFTTRTNELFGLREPAANYDFLSGLVIGQELKERVGMGPVILVGSDPFDQLYRRALESLGLADDLLLVDADEALVAGQWLIRQLNIH